MYIKKDGFIFHPYIDNAIIAEDNRIGDIVTYINQNSISHIVISGAFYKLTDLNFIADCHSISEVTISSNSITDCTGLYEAVNLIKLTVPDSFPDIDMSNLKSLQEFAGCINILQNISNCTSLKKLYTHGNFPGQNLYCINSFANLEELRITHSNIASLLGIAELKNLISLKLYYLKNLSDISQLIYISDTTREIEFENCPQLDGYDVLGNLSNIKKLCTIKCSSIPTLSFINGMTELKMFDFYGTNIADGDLTPCLSLDFVCFNNKKHHSHTLKELNPELVIRQKQSENVPVKTGILNNEEIEPELFVSVYIVNKTNEIICECIDNRGLNTVNSYYSYLEQKGLFISKNGGVLPDYIAKNNSFINALKKTLYFKIT